MMKRLDVFIFVLCFGGVCWAGSSDRSALVDELGRQGMIELLDRLAEREGGDAVFDGEVEVARLRVRAGDASLDESLRGSAVGDVVGALSGLIERNRDHVLVPIWRTDLGELILVDLFQLAERNAAEFYEFGVPTASQRAAFEGSVVRALRELSEADRRFGEMKDIRGRQSGDDPRRIGEGLWRRIKRDYVGTKTPYLLAHAGYYTALLGDGHGYYQHLGDRGIPGQRKRPDQERDRLLGLAIERSKGFTEGSGVAVSEAAKCLMARAMLRRAGEDAGVAGGVIDSLAAGGFYRLLGELGRSLSLLRSGDIRGSRSLLVELEGDARVRENLFYRLLVVDRLHLLKLSEAEGLGEEQRAGAVSGAYGVYETLIADPSLGEQAVGLKNYIYQRWESTLSGGVGDAVGDGLPLPVMKAVAEMSRVAGQNLMIEADQAEQGGDVAGAVALRVRAGPKLDRAIALSHRGLGTAGVDEAGRAGLMFNLGMAMYFKADGDVDGQLAAAEVWAGLADQLPARREAGEAIEIAVSVLRQLHSHKPRPDGVDEGYRSAVGVLFERFGTSGAADGERLYYAYAVLVPGGEYARAAELLERVPRGHEQYFEAQRERLFCLMELMRGSSKIVDVRVAERQLEEASERLIREAGSVSSGDAGVGTARNAVGWARLMRAELAISRGRVRDALGVLEGFDREYADDEELLRESLAKGIVALAQAGDYQQVLTRAQSMMQKFPDDAAAVIDGVLEDLDVRIDRIRQSAVQTRVERERQEMLGQAMALARTTEGLSQMLLEWAIGQGYSEDDLVAFRLLLAKGRRLAGKPDGAVLLLEPLIERYADHPGVIHQVAEAYFAKGGEASLIAAAVQFDRLIVGLEGQEDDELKRIWWNAWMRRLQVSDILDRGAADVPLRVRQLRLTDPNLGGEPYRSVLSKLEVKHGAQ